MSRGFELVKDADFGAGRLGRIHTPEAPQEGAVETPAFFPVLNLIGGPTPVSGGIWSRLRNRLFDDDKFQGAMFQAMSFLDFHLNPDSLETWRTEAEGLHEWHTGHDSPKDNPDPAPFTQPLFVDSGGFKLMNSRTFGSPPEEGGDENEWGIYTNPESILSLQYDYGADMLATLDYPIPPDLNDAEKKQRVEDSINSAVECIRLLEEDEKYVDWDPTVYAAIHGHNYEEIAYYVSNLLQRTEYESTIDGFAVGSLVPLRSGNIGTLVDIVQGATDAIPPERRDEIALHVFGIGGRLAPLLATLGVDSYDSSTYIQAAQHKKFIIRETGEKKEVSEIDAADWDCKCEACKELTEVGFQDMKFVFNADRSYKPVEVERDGQTMKYMKSDFYALIAHHNFHVFQKEVDDVRTAINNGRLEQEVQDAAENNDDIASGLARAASRWPELEAVVPDEVAIDSNAPETNPETYQTIFNDEGEIVVPSQDGMSLSHTPSDFNLQDRSFEPDRTRPICLLVPCSQTKPYSDSRTHGVIDSRLKEAGLRDSVEKISVSGLYGPVPEEYEKDDAILSYDYVLTDADTSQIDLVTRRLKSFLGTYGDEYEQVFGYATSKTYRVVIDDAFTQTEVGKVLPTDPPARRLTEHFRNEHLDELAEKVQDSLNRMPAKENS